MAPNPSIPKVKILFLGDSGVGKTALLRQFLKGEFTRTTSTTGFDVEFKLMEIQNRQVNLEIWVSGLVIRMLLESETRYAPKGHSGPRGLPGHRSISLPEIEGRDTR